MTEDQEQKQAKALEVMMGTDGWTIFVDKALEVRSSLVNSLVQETDEKEIVRLQARIQNLDDIFENPSQIVEMLIESRKRS